MKTNKSLLVSALMILFAAAALGQTVGSTAITTGSHLRVRQGPSLTAGIITEVDKGVTGEVLDAPEGIEWVKLRIPSANVEGWVHRDYLEFPGMTAKPATGSATETAPAPKKVPYVFAEVSNADGRLFIHGHFKEGLPVLLLDERQIQVWRGKTIAQGMYENPAVGIFRITDIGLDQGERLAVEPVLAIVGYPEGYAAIHPNPVGDPKELRRLDGLAHDLSKDFVRAEVASLGARLASAASFPMGRETSWLLEYEHPYGGSYEPMPEHSYVIMTSSKAWHVFARCGDKPILFRLNGRYFMSGMDRCCECGGRTKYVIELGGENLRYTNSDWGS